MVKKWRKQIWIIGIFCFVVISMYGCGSADKQKCKEVIGNFERSCNALDVKGILNCIDPTVSDPIKALLALGNIISDQSLDEYLIEIMDNVSGGLADEIGAEDSSASEVFASIQITPEKYMVKSEKGMVSCTAIFLIKGMEITKKIDIDMIKKNDGWYISGVSLKKEN